MTGHDVKAQQTTGQNHREVPLKDGLNRKLAAYALAAGTACLVGVLPAKADIIYSSSFPTDCPPNSGCTAIEFGHTSTAGGSSTGRRWNRVYGYQAGAGVVALFKGQQVGPSDQFLSEITLAQLVSRRPAGGSWRFYSASEVGGANYVGIKFLEDGQEHYGWVQLQNAGCDCFWLSPGGWAYNTVANAPINAGQTTATPEPPTLGLLALGSLGLGFWRKRKAGNTVQRHD
jgi:hypothetical protein